MTRELDEIALSLDAVVRSVPGVAALFSATPAIVHSARELTPGSAALTEVAADAEGIAIVASVGVTGTTQARVTAQAVSEAIRDAIRGGPAEHAVIRVTVSRVVG
jgi:hypothetical protein